MPLADLILITASTMNDTRFENATPQIDNIGISTREMIMLLVAAMIVVVKDFLVFIDGLYIVTNKAAKELRELDNFITGTNFHAYKNSPRIVIML